METPRGLPVNLITVGEQACDAVIVHAVPAPNPAKMLMMPFGAILWITSLLPSLKYTLPKGSAATARKSSEAPPGIRTEVPRQPSPTASVAVPPVLLGQAAPLAGVVVPPPPIVVMVYGIARGKVASGTGGAAPTVTTITLEEGEVAKLPLALYVALTLSVPSGRNALNVETPFVSTPVPTDVLPLKNCTLPVGVPAPEEAVTVAVSVTGVPTVVLVAELTSVVVVGAAVTEIVLGVLATAALVASPL